MTDARPDRRLAVDRRGHRGPHRARRLRGLLRRPRGRRPGDHPEDLLLPRGDRDRGRCWRSSSRASRASATCARATSATTRSRRSASASASAFSVLVVITGSIWAKASWGTWWVWTDPRLVTFLIVLLLYAAYFVLRLVGRGRAALPVLGDLLDRGLRVGAAVVLLGAGGALVRAPGRLHPERREHAGHDAGLVRRQPARRDRRLPHGPAAGADPAPRRQGAAPRQACAWRPRREHGASTSSPPTAWSCSPC